MQKIKSIFPTKDKVHSPSPDSRRSNRVQPTSSPSEEIEKFLAFNKRQVKLKKTNPLKLLNLSQKSETKNSSSSQKCQQCYEKIKELEEEIEEYKGYMVEYEELAYKNKKLEQQMEIILQELETRNQDADKNSKNNSYNFGTLENSIEERNTNFHRSTPSPPRNRSREEEIEDLYDHIENLEGTIKTFVLQSKELEFSIKKNVKEDMNEMQKKLMNYIFEIEEKVNLSASRNYEGLERIKNSRKESEEVQNNQNHEETRQNFQMIKKEDKIQQLTHPEDEIDLRLSITETKKESVVSLINLEISSSVEASSKIEEKTSKKRNNRELLPNLFQNCSRCEEHETVISQQDSKIKALEEEINSLRLTNSELKMSQQKSPDIKKTRTLENFENKPSIIFSIPEEEEENEHLNKSDKYSRRNSLQSHINIIMDSSMGSSFEGIDKNSIVDRSFADQNQKSEANAECYLKIDKVKDQLIDIMQEIQEIVHTCNVDPEDEMLNHLNLKHQEQEVPKPKSEIEETKKDKNKLEKLMKLEIGEEEEKGVPYFKNVYQTFPKSQFPESESEHPILSGNFETDKKNGPVDKERGK